MPEQNTVAAITTKQDDLQDGFNVQLNAFSGPLDLLCHLVDIREMDPVKLNLTELMAQYIQFLVSSKRTTLNEIAEFFAFASRLLLRKVHSLFPVPQSDSTEEDEELQDDYVESEEELRQMLETFRPYRNAAVKLAEYQQQREKSFLRICDDDTDPSYDIGDLYSLASKWWELLARYNEAQSDSLHAEDSIWDDIPDAVPEERQVEQRIDELSEMLKNSRMTLADVLLEKSKKNLIVTLLALLEMSRCGRIHLVQSLVWGNVEIVSAE